MTLSDFWAFVRMLSGISLLAARLFSDLRRRPDRARGVCWGMFLGRDGKRIIVFEKTGTLEGPGTEVGFR